MYSTLLKSHDMLSVCVCNEVIHFENNQNPPHGAYPDYNSLWKSGRIFSYPNNIHSTLNHPTENLALDEVIVKLKGGVLAAHSKKAQRIWNENIQAL